MLVPCWILFILACWPLEGVRAVPQNSWSNDTDPLNLTAGAALPPANRGLFTYTGAYAPTSPKLEAFTASDLISTFTIGLAGRTAAAVPESEIRLYFGPLTAIAVSLEFLHFTAPMQWDAIMTALRSLVVVLHNDWELIGRSTFQAIISSQRLPLAMISVNQETGARTVIPRQASLLSGEGRRFRSRRLPFQKGKGVFDQAIGNLQAMVQRYQGPLPVPNGYVIDLVDGVVHMRCLLSSLGPVWPVFTAEDLIQLLGQVQGWFHAQGRFEGFGLELYFNGPGQERIGIGHLFVNQEYFAPPMMLGNTSTVAVNGSGLGEAVTASDGWNVSSSPAQDQGSSVLDFGTATELNSEDTSTTKPQSVAAS